MEGGLAGGLRYNEGQEPLLYLVTRIEDVQAAGRPFVFTDGHGLAAFTKWFEQVIDLDKVDWPLVRARYWADNLEDNDRKRRKQAECLIWQFLPWSAVRAIVTLNEPARQRAAAVLTRYPHRNQPRLMVSPGWYY